MTWTHDPVTQTLSDSSGFVIRFEPVYQSMSKPWSQNSVVAEYQGQRWRGTMLKPMRKDASGVDQMRLFAAAADEFVRILRARVKPHPEDNQEDFFPD